MANYEWWSEPIYDRTQADIDFATPKGYLNALDMNRIEGNIGTLARNFGLEIVTKKWEIGEFLYDSDIRRVLFNTAKIKEAIKQTTEQYTTLLYWNDLNIIERLLLTARGVYLMLIDWDCFECQFETWNDFETKVPSWNYLEKEIGCQNTKTWLWLEEDLADWEDLEAKVSDWSYFECPNKQGGL